MKKIVLFFQILGLGYSASFSQAISISEARSLPTGTEVTITGIVTNSGELGAIRYLQDNTAGIGVYSYDLSLVVATGDSITVTGTLKDYNGLLELDPVKSWTKHSSGHKLPEPLTVTISDLNESNEGMIVKIENVLFDNGCSRITGGTYTFSVGENKCQIYIRSNDSPLVGEILPSQTVTLIGINSQFYENYQILIRKYNDLFLESNIYFTSCLETKNLSSSGFDLYWTTNIPGTTELFFGNTPDLELGIILIEEMTTDHMISIEERNPSELLYVRAFSVADEDTAISAPGIFMTASTSSGDIKVYFNRSVDTTVSSGTSAIRLFECIDDTLINYIDRAKYSIDMAIYNYNTNGISDITAALNAAHSRGIEIRIVSDMNMEDNSGWDELDPAIGRIVSPEENYDAQIGIMHNKFVIFDALSPDPNDPVVWTGSTNFTPGQINEDPNNVIILQDQSLAKTYRMEFEEMFGSSGLQPDPLNSKFGIAKTNNTPHEFIIGGHRVESYFSPSDDVNNKIEATIKTADFEVYANTMLITRNFLAYAITDLADAGIDAKVVVNSESQSELVVDILKNLVDNFRDYDGTGILHHKTLIVDAQHPEADPIVLTGCHNWSSSADTRNDENTLIVHDSVITNIYYQEFVERFREGKIIGQVPVAANDFISMNQGDTLFFNVFDNDMLPGPVTLEIIHEPLHGYAIGENNGEIGYLPFADFNGLDTLVYTVCAVENARFCDSAKMIIWVKKVVGINESISQNVSLFPIPASGFIILNYQGETPNALIRIFNLNGQMVMEEKMDLMPGNNPIRLKSNTLAGIYIMEIHTGYTVDRLRFLIE